MLDSAKKPHDLEEVTRAIENTQSSADSVNPAFQKQLRQQLLLKYPTMAAVHKNKKPVKESSPKPMRFKAWAFALALLVLIVVGGVASYPLIPAPEVQGYSLKDTVRKISYNAPIKIVFSQPMDQKSVENAFKIDPKIDGSFEWQNNTLMFKPTQQFKVGDSFKVSVDTSAHGILQKALNSYYEENFEIVAAPQITLFSPATDSSDVPVDAKLTMHFDRPMIPLTSLDQSDEKVINVKIEPAIAGKAKWLGTSSMMFTPSSNLAYATHYTVTVPQGTVSDEGGSTDKDFVYTFDTLKPAFESSEPTDLDPYQGPNTNVKLTFNQPMNVQKAGDFVKIFRFKGDAGFAKKIDWNSDIYNDAAVKDAKIKGKLLKTTEILKQTDKSQWEEVPASFHYYTADEFKKDYLKDNPQDDSSGTQETQEIDIPKTEDLQKTLVVQPSSALSDDSVYMVQIGKDFPGATGTFGLKDDGSVVFKTVGALDVVSTDPKDNASNFSDKTLTVEFNQPMDQSLLNMNVVVTPKAMDDNNKEQKPVVELDGNTTLYIHYPFEPSTKYTVTVPKGEKSLDGKVYDKDLVFHFTTAALNPTFSLVSSPDISVLDATKPRIYYVRSTNVDTLHFQFKKLSDDEFKSLYPNGYVSSLSPSPDGMASFDMPVKKDFNKNVVTAVDLEKLTGQTLSSGNYYFAITSPNVVDPYNKTPLTEKQIFAVTSYALATKLSQQQLLVWATSMKDGAPVEGMDIEATNTNDESVLTGKTDKDGLVVLNVPQSKNGDQYIPEYMVKGHVGDDTTLTHTTWSDGVSPWNFNIDYSSSIEKYFVYSYTDRPIYRPGDAVDFKGLVRVNNDLKYNLPDRNKVHVSVHDSQDQEVYKQDLDINKNGTFNGQLQLGANAATGDYQMIASLATSDEPQYAHTFYQSFKVAAYRKPDYQMTVTPDKDSYVNGETAQVKVNGQYFFGAPMPDAPVSWTVKSNDYYFFLPADSKSPYASQWFSFSDDGFLCYWGCKGQSAVVSEGKGKLDANGNFTIPLPLNIKDKKVSQLYTIEATISDVNNQTVSNRASFAVHQGEYYVGVMSQDSVSTKGKPANFDVITIDKDGNPVAGKSVDVTLYQREWNTVKKKNVDSDFYYDNNYTDTLKDKKTVTTDDKGHANVSFAPATGGDYKVGTFSTDSRGNTVTSATEVYVTSGDEFVNWGQENNDRIELVPDKLEYKVGDTAHVLIKSPYTNVYALITHERQNVVFKQVIKITSNSQTIDVPITEDSLPNEFVSVLLVKGNNTAAGLQDPGKEVDERNVSAFKLGYATLQVDTSTRKLTIQVTSDQAKYHPGDNVDLHVKTLDASGKPVKAEVSVSVVDKSVLSLTENVTADLLTAFYRSRYLGVQTAETLTKALSRLNVQVESGLKGGGGGAIAKRGTFKDTAFWQANVDTDASGNGEVKFKVPDNLTTWQVLTIGITNDTLVGSQKMDFIVSKDVLNRPVLPRFLIVNDHMTVGTVVHNYLDHAVDLNVDLKATGVNITGTNQQKIHLESGKEQVVNFTIDVLDQQEADFTFEAIDSNDSTVGDIVENKLPIEPFSFPENVATSAEVTDSTQHVETVWLPTGIDPKFGELKISAASTLAGTLAEGLQYLVQYPYGCAEQIASSLLPNLAVKEIAKLPGLGADKLIDEKVLSKNVTTGLQGLYKYQQSNGGWGLWENSEPTPYLSSYVLYTLFQAQKAGYAVDQKVMKNGLAYVKGIISKAPLAKTISNTNLGNSPANQRAFALFVLAEMGQGDLGLSNNLFDYNEKESMNLFAKAYLAMDFDDLMKQQSLTGTVRDDVQKKIDTLKGEILTVAKETPRGVAFEEPTKLDYMMFDSNERTTALVLQMLARVDNGNVLIPKILRNMLMEKKDGHFSTTQETAESLLALAEYLKSSKELEPNYSGVVSINGTEKMNKSFTQSNLTDIQSLNIPLTDLLPNNQDNQIVASRSGTGKMYFDMNLKYYLPTDQVKARDEGIFVDQQYFKMDDTKMENPVTTVKVGDNLVGKMTIIVPEDRYYVMAEDYLPAGLEGVDFSLQTAQQSLQDQMDETDDGSDSAVQGSSCDISASWDCWEQIWRFGHSEVRDDRMMFFADYLPKGVYELKYVVRATTPGTFHDLPALVQETYFPEVFGRSMGEMFTVQP